MYLGRLVVGNEGDILVLFPSALVLGWEVTGQLLQWNVVGGFPRRASLTMSTSLNLVCSAVLEPPKPCLTPCRPYCSEQTGRPAGTSQRWCTRYVL